MIRLLTVGFGTPEYRAAEDGSTESRRVVGCAVKFDSDSQDIGFTERILKGAITQELIDNSDVYARMDHRDDVVLARSNHGVGSLKLVLLGCFTVIAATADHSQVSVRASSSRTENRYTVVLDAGHGGMDSGAVGINGELEKNINLAVVRDLKDMLTLSGFNVVLTRDALFSRHRW